MRFLSIILILLASIAMAEINDMPEGATLDEQRVIPHWEVASKHKGCKIICPDTRNVTVTYHDGNAEIDGCRDKMEVDCNDKASEE